MPKESSERRHAPRRELKQMVRIRPFDPELPPEYCTTFNASSEGLYFTTSSGHYAPGMKVYVTSDYQPGSPLNREVSGNVTRVEHLEGGGFGVAIHVFSVA